MVHPEVKDTGPKCGESCSDALQDSVSLPRPLISHVLFCRHYFSSSLLLLTLLTHVTRPWRSSGRDSRPFLDHFLSKCFFPPLCFTFLSDLSFFMRSLVFPSYCLTMMFSVYFTYICPVDGDILVKNCCQDWLSDTCWPNHNSHLLNPHAQFLGSRTVDLHSSEVLSSWESVFLRSRAESRKQGWGRNALSSTSTPSWLLCVVFPALLTLSRWVLSSNQEILQEKVIIFLQWRWDLPKPSLCIHWVLTCCFSSKLYHEKSSGVSI